VDTTNQQSNIDYNAQGAETYIEITNPQEGGGIEYRDHRVTRPEGGGADPMAKKNYCLVLHEV
jgi:hypothetical protein